MWGYIFWNNFKIVHFIFMLVYVYLLSICQLKLKNKWLSSMKTKQITRVYIHFIFDFNSTLENGILHSEITTYIFTNHQLQIFHVLIQILKSLKNHWAEHSMFQEYCQSQEYLLINTSIVYSQQLVIMPFGVNQVNTPNH